MLEKVGSNSYRVNLPSTFKVHPVLNSERLRKAANDPLPGQVNKPEPPVEFNGLPEWEIEDILAVRQHHGRLKYKAKWVGFDDDPAWYPASNFKGAPHKIRDFHQRYSDKPGPPRRLDAWIKAWEHGEEDRDNIDDDRA